MKPLVPVQANSETRLSDAEVKTFAARSLVDVMKSMLAAFKVGTFLPGNARQEHMALMEHLHDALMESIGRERYTAEVRERFSFTVQGNVILAMNHASRWIVS